uniref:L19 ribosomal protein n=1 Tax=Solanum tuberosum TaxID=4113 RepID=M1BCQ6_SOLTU
MPSAELLAAAAKLTEAQAELNEDTDLFIGPPPPPPALVTEVESANEIECFEEVTRIIASDADNSYDVLGANRNILNDNIKKQYLKLSRIVHALILKLTTRSSS